MIHTFLRTHRHVHNQKRLNTSQQSFNHPKVNFTYRTSANACSLRDWRSHKQSESPSASLTCCASGCGDWASCWIVSGFELAQSRDHCVCFCYQKFTGLQIYKTVYFINFRLSSFFIGRFSQIKKHFLFFNSRLNFRWLSGTSVPITREIIDKIILCNWAHHSDFCSYSPISHNHHFLSFC